jgi:hypothetical protein
MENLITGIKSISGNIPSDYMLSQNYPNPFNPKTRFRFAIPPPENGSNQSVQLKIFDILGSEVETLVNEQLKPGTYEVDWPAPAGNASNYPSGVYFYKLVAGNFSETKKMVLVK